MIFYKDQNMAISKTFGNKNGTKSLAKLKKCHGVLGSNEKNDSFLTVGKYLPWFEVLALSFNSASNHKLISDFFFLGARRRTPPTPDLP